MFVICICIFFFMGVICVFVYVCGQNSFCGCNFFIFFKDWIGLGHILRLMNRIRSGWTRPVGPDGAGLGLKKNLFIKRARFG